MTVAGGLRQRLIRDSVYYTVYDALDQLGWFDTTRPHAPVTFSPEPLDNSEPIPLNTLVLFDEDLREADAELGSRAVFASWTMWLDFYGENNVIARELINDIRAILSGRYESIGRGDCSVEVFDWRLATPTRLFNVEIEDIVVDRASDFPRPWLKHWYACRFTIVDEE